MRGGLVLYKNNTYGTYTFYGVEFKPGEVKEVPGNISVIGFIQVDAFRLPEKHEPVIKNTAEQVVEAETTTDKRSKGKKLIKETEGEE
jgi:hypothetical protein